MKCWTCKKKKEIPGDCHIQCMNPPKTELRIGCGGNERYTIADKQAKESNAVVRCVWPGCGAFPYCFDGNTVFGCINHSEQG